MPKSHQQHQSTKPPWRSQGHRLGWLLLAVLLVALTLKIGYSALSTTTKPETKSDRLVAPSTQLIEADQYDELASQATVFTLDVHVPEQDHLPHTDAFVPFDQLKQHMAVLPADKKTPLLVYCRSGRMSKLASAELSSLGYQTIYDLNGGKNAYDAIKTPLVITPKTRDLGPVIYGQVATTQFTLRNNSTNTVTIKKVSTSCGCTTATTTTKILAPGASTVVNVSFDPAVHKNNQDLGAITRTIFINTDHSQMSEVTATITANVIKQ